MLLANSGDPDQMPHYVASDLGLHCLPMYPFLGFSRQQWVKVWIADIKMHVSATMNARHLDHKSFLMSCSGLCNYCPVVGFVMVHGCFHFGPFQNCIFEADLSVFFLCHVLNALCYIFLQQYGGLLLWTCIFQQNLSIHK